MLCGNKTDECPNCKKYIRRAVFVYHYENNCTNLDESETDTHSSSRQTNTISTFQPNNASRSSSGLTTGNTNNISTVTIQPRTSSQIHGTAGQRSNSGRLYRYSLKLQIFFCEDFCESKRITIQCEYCYQQCEIGEREIHQVSVIETA